jgi:hypothetical protein
MVHIGASLSMNGSGSGCASGAPYYLSAGATLTIVASGQFTSSA